MTYDAVALYDEARANITELVRPLDEDALSTHAPYLEVLCVFGPLPQHDVLEAGALTLNT